MEELARQRELIKAEIAAVTAANEARGEQIAALEQEIEESQTRVVALKAAVDALETAESKLAAIGPLLGVVPATSAEKKKRLPIKTLVVSILEQAGGKEGLTVDEILTFDTEGIEKRSLAAFLSTSKSQGIVARDEQKRWRLLKGRVPADADAPADSA